MHRDCGGPLGPDLEPHVMELVVGGHQALVVAGAEAFRHLAEHSPEPLSAAQAGDGQFDGVAHAPQHRAVDRRAGWRVEKGCDQPAASGSSRGRIAGRPLGPRGPAIPLVPLGTGGAGGATLALWTGLPVLAVGAGGASRTTLTFRTGPSILPCGAGGATLTLRTGLAILAIGAGGASRTTLTLRAGLSILASRTGRAG
jgi:hypothetical protein